MSAAPEVPVSVVVSGEQAGRTAAIVGNNDEVTLTAEGDGADAALDQLAELLEIDHDA